MLDLNFAYAPSCAHDPRWACPSLLPGTWSTVDVPVGELGRLNLNGRDGCMSDVAATAFLAAAAAHAGFQATVTLVVYPTLSHVRAAHWRQAHDRHSQAIVPLVAVAYLALAATGAWWLAADWSALAVVAVVLAALSMAVTAVVAAPLHRRLVQRDDAALDRLLGVDRRRTVLASAAAVVAVAGVLA